MPIPRIQQSSRDGIQEKHNRQAMETHPQKITNFFLFYQAPRPLLRRPSRIFLCQSFPWYHFLPAEHIALSIGICRNTASEILKSITNFKVNTSLDRVRRHSSHSEICLSDVGSSFTSGSVNTPETFYTPRGQICIWLYRKYKVYPVIQAIL